MTSSASVRMQRPLDLVDGAIEGVERYPPELLRERLLQQRIKVLPKPAAAGDYVFPKPRLALMHAGRRPVPERRAFERGAHALLIERMAGLVQRREQCLADVAFIDPGRDAHVTDRELGAERMMRRVEPSTMEVIAHALGHRAAEIELGIFGERSAQTAVVGRRLLGYRLRDRHQLFAQLRQISCGSWPSSCLRRRRRSADRRCACRVRKIPRIRG